MTAADEPSGAGEPAEAAEASRVAAARSVADGAKGQSKHKRARQEEATARVAKCSKPSEIATVEYATLVKAQAIGRRGSVERNAEFLEASSYHEREDAIQLINSYKLITRRPAESAFDLHRLVHSALRGWIGQRGMLGEWTQRAITRLCRIFPNDSQGNRSKWRRMLPHAKYALSHSHRNEKGTEKMKLVLKYARALLSDGRYNEAEELFLQVMETTKRVLGDEHPETLISMNNLSFIYSKQSQWKEAEELFVQVMEMRNRVLGDEHPNTLLSMGNLALTYNNQGRWKEAEELEVQVMETRKTKLGVDHPDTMSSMNNLTFTFKGLGKVKEAFSLMQNCCRLRDEVLGPHHPHTVSSQTALAAWQLETIEVGE